MVILKLNDRDSTPYTSTIPYCQDCGRCYRCLLDIKVSFYSRNTLFANKYIR